MLDWDQDSGWGSDRKRCFQHMSTEGHRKGATIAAHVDGTSYGFLEEVRRDSNRRRGLLANTGLRAIALCVSSLPGADDVRLPPPRMVNRRAGSLYRTPFVSARAILAPFLRTAVLL